MNGSDILWSCPVEQGELTYVKTWFRTKHAVMFVLSSGYVQMNFYDYTELILREKDGIVTYTDKSKMRKDYMLGSEEQKPDLQRRLR